MTRPMLGTLLFTVEARYENGQFVAYARAAEIVNQVAGDVLNFDADVSEAAVRAVVEMIDPSGQLWAEREAWAKRTMKG